MLSVTQEKLSEGPALPQPGASVDLPINLEKVEQVLFIGQKGGGQVDSPPCISWEHWALIISWSVAGNPNHPEKKGRKGKEQNIVIKTNDVGQSQNFFRASAAMKGESDKGFFVKTEHLICQSLIYSM